VIRLLIGGTRVLTIHQLSSQRALRAAVVGAGVFGRHHATKYMRLPGVKLNAIADTNAEARRHVASHLHVPAFADWRELLGEVDVVSICSPAVTHAPIVRGFLEAGVHVLVEKPIATTIEEAEQLIALARSRDLVLTVGHQERFVFAKSGLLDYDDAPLFVECVREGPWTGRGTDVSVVLDLMIHDLDLIHRLVPGALKDVRACGRSVHGESHDKVMASLTFENGAEVDLTADRAAETRRRSMRVVYDDGEIEIDFLSRDIVNTTGRMLHPLEMHDPLAESVAAFVEAVRAGASALVRPEEARLALETALLIEETMVLAVAVQEQKRTRVRRTA
jgi:predicted dehydrogenase